MRTDHFVEFSTSSHKRRLISELVANALRCGTPRHFLVSDVGAIESNLEAATSCEFTGIFCDEAYQTCFSDFCEDKCSRAVVIAVAQNRNVSFS